MVENKQFATVLSCVVQCESGKVRATLYTFILLRLELYILPANLAPWSQLVSSWSCFVHVPSETMVTMALATPHCQTLMVAGPSLMRSFMNKRAKDMGWSF